MNLVMALKLVSNKKNKQLCKTLTRREYFSKMSTKMRLFHMLSHV